MSTSTTPLSTGGKIATAAVAAVVPCFNVGPHVEGVVDRMPSWVRWIVLVDDASTDHTGRVLAELARRHRRVHVVTHPANQGVGGAVVSGLTFAMTLGAEIAVKVDGDGQMDPVDIPVLLRPLLLGKADYVKGNRFRDVRALRRMPLARRLGNLGLSFLVKLATGYWRVFDPTNGYVAVRAELLPHLALERLDRGYFFEIDMLYRLSLLGAVVRDVALPARYGSETSSLRIRRVLFEFPPKLLRITLKRFALKKLAYDLTPDGLYLLLAVPLLLFAASFGGIEWARYGARGVPAPGGTVMLPVLAAILGTQFLLGAITADIQAEPKEPVADEFGAAAAPRAVDQKAS